MMLESAQNLPQTERAAPWRGELKALLSVGAPMALTQLIQFSVNTIDVLMIGRLGAAPLAAASLGLVLYYVAFLAGFGPAMAVSPLVSQALGADRDNVGDVRRSVRMGLWAIALIFAPALILFLCTEAIVRALGQPPALAALAAPYVLALAPGLPFMLAVLMLRNVLAAVDRTRAPLVVIILTTALNGFLNYLLIYGNWGFPRLELVGAGIASSVSHAVGFLLLVGYMRVERESRRLSVFADALRPDWERLKEIFRLGWPIGVTTAFEAMLFNACVFLMGRIGVAEVAAYQVAINVAALGFMLPFGLSMAGAVRVGLAAGARDAARARRAAVLTIGLCAGAIMIVAIPCLLAPHFVAGLYLEPDEPDNARVLALAASFLPVAAAFALFDAVQVAANQCLRGLKDVRMPMLLTGISYWAIGFPVAAYFGLATPLGAVGVWWGLLAGLASAAALLGARLYLLLRT
ncbi:MATE family efflux transporter [Amphiplicatus metriothermophilus]|nr:MATE family efflux transporter [Amphiplicatus metriothermophilus]MBB5519602.1 MATE family multidrug resistance protein [Amphiplicatus metriothermophilus]